MRELITQASDVLQSNPIVASSPPLTRGLDANKKNEIRSAGSQDISSPNLGVVNSSQTYGIYAHVEKNRHVHLCLRLHTLQYHTVRTYYVFSFGNVDSLCY